MPYTGTGTPATVQTMGAVVSTLPTTRTVNLINQCNFPVWFSLNGASVAGTSCNAQGAGCPPGTSCNTGTKECYWNNPLPNTGSSYKLNKLADGSNTNSVTIPAYNYGGVQWSGNISASTLCNGTTSCGQADCDNNGGSTSCAPGQGFSQPATQAEVTMNVSSSDSYDVEVINGFHIPISMAPIYYPNVPTPANNYTCGIPGSFTPGNGFGACNWTPAQVPTPTGGTGYSSGYYWVSKTTKTCNITSAADQCGPTQLCGLYQDPTNKAFSQLCGDFLGYWSADEVCSYSGLPSAVDNFFGCSQPLPNVSTASNPPYFPLNATLYRLMECKVPSKDPNPLYNSCYNSYASGDVQTCCGCVDWWLPSKTPNATINSNGAAQSCGTQVDPQWTQFIQPKIQWMKQTCPSVYTYPFDDKTSGFTCSNNLPGDSNSVGYTITFCQGADPSLGNTGLPPGSINDGRGVGG